MLLTLVDTLTQQSYFISITAYVTTFAPGRPPSDKPAFFTAPYAVNNAQPRIQDSIAGKESGNLYTPFIGTTEYSAKPAECFPVQP